MSRDMDFHQIESNAKARLHQTGRVGAYVNTSTAMMQLTVAAVYLLSAIVLTVIFFLIFGFGILGAASLGVVLALIPSGLVGRRWAKRAAQAAEQEQANIRANREAEKQKQIDAMLRKASNVPEVKR